MKKNHEIRIRDPFILPQQEEQRYYMYGTTDPDPWQGKGVGFDAYYSEDLEHWEGPFPVFRPEEDFWAEKNFWAPEVHLYNGKYYMFASFYAEGRHRGTQVLVSEGALGPFKPLTLFPVTPKDWDCLDGTLYIEDGVPHMVFCREWLQVSDGQICTMPLSTDLASSTGEPQILWTASQSGWSCPSTGGQVSGDGQNFVTDGPFLYRNQENELLCIWSSFYNHNYAIGIAKSSNGRLNGPWEHMERPLLHEDGGHGMIFNSFDGRLLLSLHQPNNSPNERPHFIEIMEKDGWLAIK